MVLTITHKALSAPHSPASQKTGETKVRGSLEILSLQGNLLETRLCFSVPLAEEDSGLEKWFNH